MKSYSKFRLNYVQGLVAVFLALMVVDSSVFATAPAGSYQFSCRDIKTKRHHLVNKNLYATCKNRRGQWVQTRLKKYPRCKGDIANINGSLRCIPHHGRRIPSGSYQRICRNIRVNIGTLTARCRARNGTYYPARLPNYMGCNGDIRYEGGDLRCIRRVAPPRATPPRVTPPRVTPPRVTPPHAGHIPPGSYRRSCRNIRVRGGTLTARCRTRHGDYHFTRMHNYRRCHGDIRNVNGNLRCVPRAAPPHAGHIPQGSYQHSCRRIRVRGYTLIAKCRSRRGDWHRATLHNYRRCHGDIQNRNARLVCVTGGYSHYRPGVIPRGSYRYSCNNIRVRRGRLIARCRTRRGYWNRTSLANYRNCQGRIKNINGYLRCIRRRIVPPVHVPEPHQPGHSSRSGREPQGSYLRTCRSVRTSRGRLYATCRTRSGRWVRSRLVDYQFCNGEIHNINGNLRCVSR